LENIGLLDVKKLQTEPFIVSSSTPISKVVGIFKEHDTYEVFMVLNGKIRMVTVRDVLVAPGLTSKAGSLTNPAPKIHLKSKISEAVKLMVQHKIKSLPIVEKNRIVGCLTATSIIKALKNLKVSFLNFKVGKLMTGDLTTINVDDSAAKAKMLMVKRKINHLPVLSNKKLSGLLTSKHLIHQMFPSEATKMGARGLMDDPRKMSFPVKDLMDSNPILATSDEKVFEVVGRMLEQEKDYVLVTLWDELQGIITSHDILKVLVQPEKAEAPIYIVGLPDDPFEAEITKTKFIRAVNMLRKGFPSIEEARSIIKTSTSIKGEKRKRYEVDVTVRTPKKLFKFSESGWDLPTIYDQLSAKIKRLMTKKHFNRRIQRTGEPEI